MRNFSVVADSYVRGILVYSRVIEDKNKRPYKTMTGRLTGGTRQCTLEACGGLRLGVRWADNTLTWPCSKGMRYDGQAWHIV